MNFHIDYAVKNNPSSKGPLRYFFGAVQAILNRESILTEGTTVAHIQGLLPKAGVSIPAIDRAIFIKVHGPN